MDVTYRPYIQHATNGLTKSKGFGRGIDPRLILMDSKLLVDLPGLDQTNCAECKDEDGADVLTVRNSGEVIRVCCPLAHALTSLNLLLSSSTVDFPSLVMEYWVSSFPCL